MQDDQSLRKDVNLSETKTDNRKPNTTNLSEEDIQIQDEDEDDQIGNIELGVQIQRSSDADENINNIDFEVQQ